MSVEKKTICFIIVLRALATCLITNSHYVGIYPTDLIANGGLLGDVLFFAISGYCLYHVKGNFVSWYGKRIWRVYPPVIIITLIYLIIGAYSWEQFSIFGWFVYPTYYHFVASIILLYIPFYFIMKYEVLRKRIPMIMCAIAIVSLIVYVIAYDKSYYHIDKVREPMIRFLFMESMLLGAYFRQHDDKMRKQSKPWLPWVVSACLVGYFASKLIFSKIDRLSEWQMINWATIFVLLYFLFRYVCSKDALLEKMPPVIMKICGLLANMTLEIYCVQYVLRDWVREHLTFPISWFVLTIAILVAAYLLKLISLLITRSVEHVFNQVLIKKGE